MNKTAYLRGYIEKLAFRGGSSWNSARGDSSWNRARGATRSTGSNVFDAAYKGVGKSPESLRPSSYISKIREQQRDLQKQRDRFTTNTPVKTRYGTMSVSYGKAKNRQTNLGVEQPPLKPTYQSSSTDRAGSRWEISPRADEIAMWGPTGIGKPSEHIMFTKMRNRLGFGPNEVVFTPEQHKARKKLGLADEEGAHAPRVLTPDQRKALMHLANTGQTQHGVLDLLASRGIQEVNPVAAHTLLTDEQREAVRHLYNQKPNNDPRIQRLLPPKDPLMKDLMERHGLEASEEEQQARTKRELDAQKQRDQATAMRGKINRYVSETPLATLRDAYNRLRSKATNAYNEGKLRKGDPRLAGLRYMRQAIIDKHRKEIYRSRQSYQDIA